MDQVEPMGGFWNWACGIRFYFRRWINPHHGVQRNILLLMNRKGILDRTLAVARPYRARSELQWLSVILGYNGLKSFPQIHL
jgi:hypothetical protein